MLLGQIKTENFLEFFHYSFDIGLGKPCKDIIISLSFFDMLKISSQEVLWILCLLDIEILYSDGVKHIIRVLMYHNKLIAVSGHIRIVISFIAHPDVASSHRKDKTKGC